MRQFWRERERKSDYRKIKIQEVGEMKEANYNKKIKVQSRDERNLAKTPGHCYSNVN